MTSGLSCEGCFNFKSELKYDEIDKIHYLQSKCDNLEKKYIVLKKSIEKNPTLKVLHDIPNEKLGELIEKIDLWKKSWEWKSNDKCEIIESSTGISGSTF